MNLEQTLNVSKKLDLYGNLLAPKQKQMLESYINYNASLSEIAENFGITRQGASDIIKQATLKLDKIEEKLGFLKKIEDAKQKIIVLTKDLTKQKQDSIISIIQHLED